MSSHHIPILSIIENTVHEYTHFATVSHKHMTGVWCNDRGHDILSYEEKKAIKDNQPSFQTLIDLACLILCSKDVDPWKIINEGN